MNDTEQKNTIEKKNTIDTTERKNYKVHESSAHKRNRKRKARQKLFVYTFLALAIMILIVVLIILGLFVKSSRKTAKLKSQNAAQVLNSEVDSTGLSDTSSTDTDSEETEEEASEVFETTQIENVESLDATSVGWGQGVQFDEENRPISAVEYQELYGKYNANYIVEDSQNIFLTFDEGYEYGCTGAILDTLKEKGVKAVFFITKPYAEQNPDLVRRMIDEGHTIGNHTVTHPTDGMPSLSIEKQQEEIMGCHQYVLDNFGYTMHLFRYPSGKYSEQSLAVVNNCNYKSVFWSFAYLDYDVDNQPEQGAALDKLVARLHPGAIYLLHAESETNTAILGTFIDDIREAGYQIEVFN